jgi:hypothetical protein
MELTINQIKEKQVVLNQAITKLLNDFNEETSVIASGVINYGYTDDKQQQYVSLKYSNPVE